MQRLLAEAEGRLNDGNVLPMLSSLAAVPRLHQMVVERCSELLDGGAEPQPDDVPCGMYL